MIWETPREKKYSPSGTYLPPSCWSLRVFANFNMGCAFMLPPWVIHATAEGNDNKDDDESVHVPGFPISFICCNVICALINVICYHIESK